MTTRRQFLKRAALFGAGLFIKGDLTNFNFLANPKVDAPSLDPTTIAKYESELVIPPAMPKAGVITRINGQEIDYYEISAQPFTQQILPTTPIAYPATPVMAYGAFNQPLTTNYPAFTIEATVDRPVRVKWINGLMDSSGHFSPHLLAVDPTLHWANPPGPRDMRPTFDTTPGAYTGPVPITTHLHGAHSHEESDGYPEAWYLPAASDIPAGYFTTGSYHASFKEEAERRYGQAWEPGSAVFQYDNDQRPTTLWYHDHTLGMTRLNVYAGLAGFFNLRGGPGDLPAGLPGPAPMPDDPPDTKYYEIPILIQDRSFNSDGSLFYPASRIDFPDDPFVGPYIPDSDISPIWNPEFFANTIVVNGKTWPELDVEQRRYRFRFLNGCDARALNLMISDSADNTTAVSQLPFWQLGNDGGFLPAPLQRDTLLLGPAERADVIVDFTNAPLGHLYLINLGPDEPFNGANETMADPATTGQVMRFDIKVISGTDPSTPPDQLTLPGLPVLGNAVRTRTLSINEEDSISQPPHGPTMAMLGTLTPQGTGNPMGWMDEVTENPTEGDTEIWEVHNFTEDAHPIHVHQVQFQVVNRENFNNGTVIDPEQWEEGFKDTVIMYPGQITRIKVKFDIAGRYVWHCHILEHEDNEMMRPLQVNYRIDLPQILR